MKTIQVNPGGFQLRLEYQITEQFKTKGETMQSVGTYTSTEVM